ncbi:chitin binding lectin, putative [Entamoeba invadens IP1]|uniref:Chitin binding lectin, putative n=1 Tax=Entamoeba invadens IP1 TaxID=370355 RepID=A0A0A1U5L1_ENTIV|nr:chitin binding lectin, putative [Entamoeba invadens IP1]ELP89613.1 chitin binding lectin, putative [Entamoeba invadens IP1]|eukprot:XP_004256384.1 chitin binding lectin, putative [Entamoeba invadens IP1]
MIAIMLLIFGSVAEYFCANKAIGFYCTDRSNFVWCHNHLDGSKMTCASGLQCKCGSSSFNPCAFSFQEVADCNGEPGDFGGDQKPAESSEKPEESSKPAEDPDDDYCD